MSSKRQKIREAIATILVAAATPAANRVYENRARPLWDKTFFSQLPAILIYTTREGLELFSVAPREYKRTLEVAIEVVASGDSEVDDTLDTITAQIEAALNINILPDPDAPECPLNDDMVLTSIELMLKDEGQGIAGSARLLYDVIYYAQAPEAVALDNFDKLATEYNLNAEQEPGDRANDLVIDIYGP